MHNFEQLVKIYRIKRYQKDKKKDYTTGCCFISHTSRKTTRRLQQI